MKKQPIRMRLSTLRMMFSRLVVFTAFVVSYLAIWVYAVVCILVLPPGKWGLVVLGDDSTWRILDAPNYALEVHESRPPGEL